MTNKRIGLTKDERARLREWNRDTPAWRGRRARQVGAVQTVAKVGVLGLIAGAAYAMFKRGH
jgi:hypothetical protein